MKKIYSAILVFIAIGTTAQKKVDLDAYNFSVSYMSLPKIKIDSTYRTYNVTAECTKLMQPFFNNLRPEETVQLEGWRKLSQKGHITIQVKFDDLLPENVSIKERTESIKNKAGQVTGTRSFYHEEVKYSFAATAVVTDYKGIHIMDILLADRSVKYTFNSPEFALRPLAEGYFVLNTFKVTADLFRNCVTRAVHDLSEDITGNFGFKEVISRDRMWIVDSKKHPEYEDHRNAFKQATDILFNVSATAPTGNLKQQLQPVIDYFEKIKKEYSSTSKHDRKMRYASYYNLAVLYYYLDDPQLMMKEAQGLILNDYDTRDGKGFEQTAIWLKNIFQTNNIYTRHFAIDVNSFKGPFEKEAFAAISNSKQ